MPSSFRPVAKLNLLTATVLPAEHLATKKPGTGVPAARLPELVGRTLRSCGHRLPIVQEIDVD
jgi:hypothetical protein